MALLFGERLRAAFTPPRYLAPPLAGIDISASGVKAVRLVEGLYGLTLAAYTDTLLPAGAFANGEIVDREAVIKAIVSAARSIDVSHVNATLPESKSYLFETSVSGSTKNEWRTAVEQHLDELVPLPPADIAFDIVKVGEDEQGMTRIAGIGFARRIVEDTLSVFDEAGIGVHALEGETFGMARALLPQGDTSTVLIVDFGKTTTKVVIVVARVPRFAATIGIGGHALTLAVQKHFGVTEAEGRRVKAEKGIVPAPGNEDYLEAMLSTVSAMRDEIFKRLTYWQEKETVSGLHEPVSRVILAGGNASVRGLSEYLEGAFKLPVASGDVFSNFASRDTWIPLVDYNESLSYGSAIGIALRERAHQYG